MPPTAPPDKLPECAGVLVIVIVGWLEVVVLEAVVGLDGDDWIDVCELAEVGGRFMAAAV